MKILEKIQKSPLMVRKIILLISGLVMGILLIFIWSKIFFKGFQNVLKKGLKNEMMKELRIPELQEKIKEGMPRLEIPSFPNQNQADNQNSTSAE